MAQRKCIFRHCHPLKMEIRDWGSMCADKKAPKVGQRNLPGALMRVRLEDSACKVLLGRGNLSFSPAFDLSVSATSWPGLFTAFPGLMKLLSEFKGLTSVSFGSPALHFLADGCVKFSLLVSVCPITLPYQLSGLCSLPDRCPTGFGEISEDVGAATPGGLFRKRLSVDLCREPFFSGSEVYVFGAAEFGIKFRWR